MTDVQVETPDQTVQGLDALTLEEPDLDRTPEDDVDAELLRIQLADECTFSTGVLEEDRSQTAAAVAGQKYNLTRWAAACNTAATKLETHASADSYRDLIRKYTADTTGFTDPSDAVYLGDEAADVITARRDKLKWIDRQLDEEVKRRAANRALYKLRRDSWRGSGPALNDALLQCRGLETVSDRPVPRRFGLADLGHEDVDKRDSVSSPISEAYSHDLPTDPASNRQTLGADEQSIAGGSEQWEVDQDREPCEAVVH